MKNFKSFPKIFALGTKYIEFILDEDVEVTEKLDGSQFVFGMVEGELKMRSKGKELTIDFHEKMFNKAVDYVSSIELPDNMIFYCEYLKSPRHNTLAYDKVPRNNLCLFGACDLMENFAEHNSLKKFAEEFGIDCAPLIKRGKATVDEIEKMLEVKSYLGGVEIEGVVVKRFESWLLGGQPMPLMAGKFVSEKFKEVHGKAWKSQMGKSKWEEFMDGYRTEARWEKAIQHLKEKGELENDPCDIGKLCIEIQKDIGQEEKEIIKTFLWKIYGKQLLRKSISGLPEYYKLKLLKK